MDFEMFLVNEVVQHLSQEEMIRKKQLNDCSHTNTSFCVEKDPTMININNVFNAVSSRDNSSGINYNNSSGCKLIFENETFTKDLMSKEITLNNTCDINEYRSIKKRVSSHSPNKVHGKYCQIRKNLRKFNNFENNYFVLQLNNPQNSEKSCFNNERIEKKNSNNNNVAKEMLVHSESSSCNYVNNNCLNQQLNLPVNCDVRYNDNLYVTENSSFTNNNNVLELLQVNSSSNTNNYCSNTKNNNVDCHVTESSVTTFSTNYNINNNIATLCIDNNTNNNISNYCNNSNNCNNNYYNNNCTLFERIPSLEEFLDLENINACFSPLKVEIDSSFNNFEFLSNEDLFFSCHELFITKFSKEVDQIKEEDSFHSLLFNNNNNNNNNNNDQNLLLTIDNSNVSTLLNNNSKIENNMIDTINDETNVSFLSTFNDASIPFLEESNLTLISSSNNNNDNINLTNVNNNSFSSFNGNKNKMQC
ncbi:hypothetical protein ABK040_006170 [Willaertia magna]